MSLCLTCSSSIPTSLSPYTTPCCVRPICIGCLARNPRLREYDPCLQCGDLTTASGTERARRGRAEAERKRQAGENVFKIEDEDDEDNDDAPGGGMTDGDEPPPYTGGDDRSSRGSRGSAAASAASSVRTGSPGRRSVKDEEEMQVVEVRHPVSRSDTILSIARRYAADPHEILKLNSLPPSTLSTQPHLLRTRRTLLISTRRVRKTDLPSSTLFDDPDTPQPVGDDTLSPEEAMEKQRRERERAVKRFQLMTKSVDPGVGAAYLSLSELDESSLDEFSSLEIDAAIEETQRVEREKLTRSEVEKSGKRAMPSLGNREQRALDAFYEDEQWEAGKGNAVPRRVEGGWRKIGDGSKLGIKV